ncbi:hypothetical protein CPter291_3549 [Collimonas pratensis]|uniref:Uncharacterized protein n=1 Tax=Collimonas pratensis TaxID=279113 RepID=A0ABM5ZA81_9BURK|nr:hypothetical protein CPter291_3549 [Collimonas pratensis]
MCVDPDTVPAQSFCAEISLYLSLSHFVGWRCFFAFAAFIRLVDCLRDYL